MLDGLPLPQTLSRPLSLLFPVYTRGLPLNNGNTQLQTSPSPYKFIPPIQRQMNEVMLWFSPPSCPYEEAVQRWRRGGGRNWYDLTHVLKTPNVHAQLLLCNFWPNTRAGVCKSYLITEILIDPPLLQLRSMDCSSCRYMGYQACAYKLCMHIKTYLIYRYVHYVKRETPIWNQPSKLVSIIWIVVIWIWMACFNQCLN